MLSPQHACLYLNFATLKPASLLNAVYANPIYRLSFDCYVN
jgi:hypothetical protein